MIRQDDDSCRQLGFPATWGDVAPDYAIDPDVVGPDAFHGRYHATIVDALRAVPTVLLVVSPTDLFGPDGIYSNSLYEGPNEERRASIEWIWPHGGRGFRVDCGIRIHGGGSRNHWETKKHSFRATFKKKYGSGELRFPLFGRDAASRFDAIVLRAVWNDGWQWREQDGQAQYVRDEFARRMQLRMAQPSAHGTFVHLYLNGAYWGLYNVVERPDASFASSYLGGNKDDWDVIKEGKAIDGTRDAWKTLLDLTEKVRKAPSEQRRTEAYYRVLGMHPDGAENPEWECYLDVRNLVDYIILNCYFGTNDWPDRNYYVARRRGHNSTGFKFFVWDAEFTLDLHSIPSNVDVWTGVAEPYEKLLRSREFRLHFTDRVQEHFQPRGALYVDRDMPDWDPDRPERNVPATVYSRICREIERAIVAESARWGDQHRDLPYTRDAEWAAERDRLLTEYFPKRSAVVLEQFRQAGLYVDGPEFTLNGGRINDGTAIAISGTPGKIYYTLDGSDPRSIGGDPGKSALCYSAERPIRRTDSAVIKARLLHDGRWSALGRATFVWDGSSGAIRTGRYKTGRVERPP